MVKDLVQRFSRAYRTVLREPDDVLRGSLPAAGLVLVGGALLLWFGPVESFWRVFDHVAGILAITGLLLAFPALSYAASTERHVKESLADLHALGELHAEERTQRAPSEALVTTNMLEAGPMAERGGDGASTTEALELRALRAMLIPWITSRPPLTEQIPGAITRRELEAAITGLSGPSGVEKVLRQTKVLALGQPAGEVSDGHGTESDLLHFTVGEESKHETTLLPLFTNTAVLRDALVRNPEWTDLSVLEMDGGDLLDQRDRDVTIVVDPWSGYEFQLPP